MSEMIEMKKEEFEWVISLAYQRGRVTPVRFISQEDIESAVSDVYKLLDLTAKLRKEARNDC